MTDTAAKPAVVWYAALRVWAWFSADTGTNSRTYCSVNGVAKTIDSCVAWGRVGAEGQVFGTCKAIPVPPLLRFQPLLDAFTCIHSELQSYQCCYQRPRLQCLCCDPKRGGCSRGATLQAGKCLRTRPNPGLPPGPVCRSKHRRPPPPGAHQSKDGQRAISNEGVVLPYLHRLLVRHPQLHGQDRHQRQLKCVRPGLRFHVAWVGVWVDGAGVWNLLGGSATG